MIIWRDGGGAYSLFCGNVAYVWHAATFADLVAEDLKECGFSIISQIVWNKHLGAISRGDYHWKHEPCWYAVRKGKSHNWQGSRKEWTVWDIQNLSSPKVIKEEGKTIHMTQKPLECMARPIRNNTAIGEAIYDPFMGSGSTMVAAHQLERLCYGVEIEPKYCQVIVDRMKKADADIQIKVNGKIV
jgi:DNA modification methylase